MEGQIQQSRMLMTPLFWLGSFSESIMALVSGVFPQDKNQESFQMKSEKLISGELCEKGVLVFSHMI